jgi:putative ABC transport system permease protein
MTRLVRLLLLAYPPAIRRAHGDELRAAVEARWRDARGVPAHARFAVDLVTDIVGSWPREWRAAAGRPPRLQRPVGPVGLIGLPSDLRTAVRLLTRAPLFALGAVLTLALGIGATSAIFSLADATLLRPLPIRAPDRVWQIDFAWSNPDFRDLEAAATPFSEVAAWSNQTFGFDRGGEAVELAGAVVSGGYFTLAGLRPVAGRLLEVGDDRAGAPPVAVLSERAWTRLAGRDPSVLGATVQLNRRPVTIVGIVPRAFRGLSLADAPEIFVPIAAMTSVGTGLLSRPTAMTNRGLVWLNVVGRLRAGATPTQATSAVTALYRRVHPPDPGAPADAITIGPLVESAIASGGADDGRRFVAVLVGATIATLLLACATVANLLLVRAERRRREMALRTALGAGRGRLMRLVLVESLVIGLVGSVGALAVARVALGLLGSFDLPGRVSIADLDLSLSPMLFAISIALGLATSLVFGLVPAWQTSRVDALPALREGSRGATRQPIRSLLVTTQVGLCVLLLAGSVAFGRAMRYASSLDLGFDIAHTAITSFNPGRARYTPVQVADVERRVEDAIRREPWATGAGWLSILPLRGSMTWTLGITGPAAPPKGRVDIDANVVSLGYFQAMAIPLRAGRTFSDADTATSPPVMTISESMSRRYWPRGDALGARVSTDPDSTDPAVYATIVGIVGDVKHDIDNPRQTMFYIPVAQHLSMLDFGQSLVVRARVPPEVALADVAAIVKRIDPRLPIGRSQTMVDHLGALLMPQRLGFTLFILFAVLAAVLTTLGIYAVVAFAVAERAREIGIRMALGAERTAVLRLVARQGVRPVASGLLVGLLAFILAGSALRSLLFALPAVNAWTLALLMCAVGAMALGATLAPARRALAVDPAVTLRQE